MTLRPLVMDESVRCEIARVVAYAAQHPLALRDMVRMMGNRSLPVPGDNPAHVVIVPVGYRCVFTNEYQPCGLCRHLSISVLGPGKAPAPVAVAVLVSEFGFRGEMENFPRGLDSLWTEKQDGGKLIVHCVQRIQEDGRGGEI